MTNEELKEKIVDIIAPWVSAYGDDEAIANALIAAGLKFDVNYSFTAAFNSVQAERERDLERRLTAAEHRAEVAERALRNAAPRLNCHGGLGKGFCRVDKCDYYHCDNDEGCVKAHLQQAEKQLAEEAK